MLAKIATQPAIRETIKVIFCNQIWELLKNETIKVTRETNALVDAVPPSGFGVEEGFMTVILFLYWTNKDNPLLV